MPTVDEENNKDINNRNLLFNSKPRTAPRLTERMPECDQSKRGTTLQWLEYPQAEQEETENSCYGLDWSKKGIDSKVGWLKMYKKSCEVMKFIDDTIEIRRVELTARGQSLAEIKIQSGIFHVDALSSSPIFNNNGVTVIHT